jgi:hypothetical protein
MWLVTEDGFFSVVSGAAFPEGFEWEPDGLVLGVDQYVLVRTRDSDSIERIEIVLRLSGHDWPDEEWSGKAYALAGTDYEHRMLMPRYLFNLYLQIATAAIDYDNFKNKTGTVWTQRVGFDVALRRGSALLETWFAFREKWPTDESIDDKKVYADG